MSEENKPQDAETPAPAPAPRPAAPGAPRPGAPGAPRPAAPGAPGAPGAPRPAAAPGAPGAPGAPRPAAAPGAPGAPGVPRPAAAPVAAAPAKKEEEAASAPSSGVSRREFLNYVWGASIALFMAQFGGLTFFFAFPRFRPGQFGGKVPANIADLPELNKPPVANDVGKFWLVNTDEGVNVLYKICTHLGCIYPWSDAAGIFACPCHGSQFKLNGDYIAGPAPRALDKFKFEVLDANGTVLAASADGNAVTLPSGAQTILVDTGSKIEGKSHF